MLAAYNGVCGRQHIPPWSSFCSPVLLLLYVNVREALDFADLAYKISRNCLGFGL